MAGEVFISYSRGDRAYVEKLAAQLKGAGIPVWYDYELATGDRFATVIQEKIRDCPAMVVVLTPAAVASEWVNLEISYAKKLRKPIFPLMRAECDLPFLIHDLHYEDVTAGGPPSDAFVQRLRSFLPSPAASRPVKQPGVEPVSRVAAPTWTDEALRQYLLTPFASSRKPEDMARDIKKLQAEGWVPAAVDAPASPVQQVSPVESAPIPTVRRTPPPGQRRPESRLVFSSETPSTDETEHELAARLAHLSYLDTLEKHGPTDSRSQNARNIFMNSLGNLIREQPDSKLLHELLKREGMRVSWQT